ncbi:DNAH1, partial [Symbiodinium necroappetens]
ALRLDYFTQLQKTVITSTSERVKEKWVNKLQKIMLQHFTNVGKGWFSIHETNPDTYRQ